LHRFASAELDSWLVQVDDDSSVCVPNLLSILSGYNPKQSLQLDEFVHGWHNSTHWMRPYSCGGAGTVFSRGAVLTTSFAEISLRLARASSRELVSNPTG
jgi:hypothetical protein